MDDRALRQKLEQLHGELQRTPAMEVETRNAIAGLIGDIRSALDSGDRDPSNYRSLTDRLKRAVDRFEVEHPSLTATIAQVIDTLAVWGF